MNSMILNNLLTESLFSQFLMNLGPEFESVRATLMNRELSPDLDTSVQDVLREDIRLKSQCFIFE